MKGPSPQGFAFALVRRLRGITILNYVYLRFSRPCSSAYPQEKSILSIFRARNSQRYFTFFFISRFAQCQSSLFHNYFGLEYSMTDFTSSWFLIWRHIWQVREEFLLNLSMILSKNSNMGKLATLWLKLNVSLANSSGKKTYLSIYISGFKLCPKMVFIYSAIIFISDICVYYLNIF